MTRALKKTWFDLEFFKSDHWDSIKEMMKESCDGRVWSPDSRDLFRSFLVSPRFRTKVVMLGSGLRTQLSVSDGLLYSTRGMAVPFETQAIFDELKLDQNFKGRPITGNLEPWAQQGILMLDVSLSKTVGALTDDKLYHPDFWEDLILEVLYESGTISPDMIFVLIGDKAREYGAQMSLSGQFRCIELEEPRQIMRGGDADSFIGSRVFTRVNNYLKNTKQATINWSLPGCNKY